MKTLVVLSALASVAFAAPSYLGRENIRTNSESWPEFVKRDKKSPQGYFYAESTPFHFAGPPAHFNSEIEGSSTSGRSFGLKKPLFKPTIIKKHNGYHVYRDSDEERAQADPHENCSKQVNFKFCDGGHKEGAFARSSNDEINTHNDDVESRIKMAKEAIENIQRDLKNIEQSPKSAGWKQREADSQAERHEDIVVARKAIDQIHKNFGNLESMSLHVEPLHQENIEKSPKHEQRMAQWKENIESIQKNVDVGANIEDILEPSNQQPGLSHFDGVDTTNFMRNSEKSEHKFKTSTLSESTKERHASVDLMREGSTEGLKVSGTELKETKTSGKLANPLLDVKIKLRDKKHNEDTQGKTGELEIKNALIDDIPVKTADHKDIESVEKNTFRTSESKKEVVSDNAHFNSMKSAETHLENEKIENGKHTQKINEKEHLESHLNEKSSGPTFEKKFDHPHVEQTEPTHFETSVKSAEHENVLKTSFNVPAIHIENQDVSSPKKAESIAPFNMRWAQKNIEDEHGLKTAEEHVAHKEHLKGVHLSANHHHADPAVESSNHNDVLHGHASHAHPSKMDMHEHGQHQHGEHQHRHHQHGQHQHGQHQHGKHQHGQHQHGLHHEKSADTDGFMQPALETSLPDFIGKSALENMMQWTHKQDGGRSAYGAAPYAVGSYGAGGGYGAGGSYGAGGGYGAVGVFPSAHVGGCAVPLLLSCSPSVVSGSLAKSGYGSGSSYGGAPAYKAADENNHNKRDIKKTNEISSKKLTHKKTIIKKPTITEKKL